MNTINRLRLTGLSSGMDTDSIIQSMMRMERLKLDRELRARTKYEWKQDALKSVSTELTAFRNTYLSVLGSKNMLTDSAYKVFNTDVQGTYKDAVTIKAGANASIGKVTVNQISKLATADSASSKDVSDGESLGEGNIIRLDALNLKEALQFDSDGNIKISITNARGVNSDGNPVDPVTREFTFNKGDTLQNMLSTINNSDVGVRMSYSRLTDGFTFEAKETGEGGNIRLNNVTGNMFGTGGGDGAFGIRAGIYDNGQNAKLKINDVEVERRSNNFAIDGIEYTLHDTTPFTVVGGDNVYDDVNIRATITQNVDSAVEKIKGFVEAYNSLISKLDTMLADRKTAKEKGYLPLTDEEKSAMTEKQIEDWEAIAKKDVMYNDSDLRALLSDLRNALYDSVESAGLTPADIGLRTGNYYEGKKGQISLDEDRLREALTKDADQVMRVFAAFPESSDPATAYKQSGFLNRVNDLMNNYTRNTVGDTQSRIDKSLYDLEKKISTMESKMLKMEEQLYARYAAMETALSKMQSQTDWISSMLTPQNSK